MEIDYNSIKNKIKYLVKKNDLLMSDFLIKIGITSQGYHKSFTNKSIKLNTLVNICNVLNIDIYYLLDQENKIDTGLDLNHLESVIDNNINKTINDDIISKLVDELKIQKEKTKHLANKLFNIEEEIKKLNLRLRIKYNTLRKFYK